MYQTNRPTEATRKIYTKLKKKKPPQKHLFEGFIKLPRYPVFEGQRLWSERNIEGRSVLYTPLLLLGTFLIFGCDERMKNLVKSTC